MTGMLVSEQRVEKIGEEWVRAITEKDFQRIGSICQPAVRSRLMTPRRIDMFETVDDLTRKVAGWFEDSSSFQREQSRFAMVGEKLAIFYHLSLEENGQRYVVEQQLYCTLRDGLVDQLSLLCSGFQPVQEWMTAPADPSTGSQAAAERRDGSSSFQADEHLAFAAAGAAGSTCAVLTPAIKRKLNEMRSGQVLEVQVDDPSVKEDIEAWCRLSGNTLLKMDVEAGKEVHFYLMKK